MRKIQFATDHFYHIYNRGTDKRKIFLDEKDYFRFIHDLYEFNNKGPALNVNFRFQNKTPLDKKPRKKFKTIEVRPQ